MSLPEDERIFYSRPQSSLLFAPASPQQAVAILILLENSVSLSLIWSDLNDRYLKAILQELELTNPDAPVRRFYTNHCDSSYPSFLEQIATYIVESSPVSGDLAPRFYEDFRDGLASVRFNFDPRNVISAKRLGDAIDVSVHLIPRTCCSTFSPVLRCNKVSWATSLAALPRRC
jgi:hypothetical protein